MKTILFLLLTLLSQSSMADLYKCGTTAGTLYQDKPCQIAQNQAFIKQFAPQAKPPSAVASNPNPLPIERDAHGKIKRSEKAKNDFKAANPCPSNGKRSGSCPDYVIDHVQPLACGGADSPDNMQWQTVSAGKEKDGWERDDCSAQKKRLSGNPSTFDKPSATLSPVLPNIAAETVYTGKRGGHYVLTKTGKKRYLPHK